MKLINLLASTFEDVFRLLTPHPAELCSRKLVSLKYGQEPGRK